MPHQCIRCSKFHEDGSIELLKGCSCGSKFFFFVKKEDVERLVNLSSNLNKDEKTQIEKDVYDLIGEDYIDKPVILELESIRILKPGQYEISLVDLFSGKPLVYKVGDGKYYIDVATTLRNSTKNLQK